jgi:hypothetical protein
MPEYFPGGAVCNRDFKVSGAMATTQFITPAVPPAKSILAGLNSSRLPYKQYTIQIGVTALHNIPPSSLWRETLQHEFVGGKVHSRSRDVYVHK